MTRVCDSITRFARVYPVRVGCAVVLTIILAFGAGYTAHLWDKFSLTERIIIPVVGGVGSGAIYTALLKLGIKKKSEGEKLNPPTSVPHLSQNDTNPKKLTEAEATKYYSDRLRLHESYMERNRAKACKINPLRVVSHKDKADLKPLQTKLGEWMEDAKSSARELERLVKDNPELEEEMHRFRSSASVVESIRNKIGAILTEPERFDIFDVKGIYDESGDLQAICISYLDQDINEYQVEWLASAPHNIKFNHPFLHLSQKRRSEGAAAALIAELVFKSFQSKVVRSISLESLRSSDPFYRHLGFVENPKRQVYSLKGGALFRFLENYGGRVHPANVTT